jgi:predicted ATPase
VPLFVEELTKSVLESGVPMVGIPTTLHDSLMARLDRLSSVRQLAQIGAAIGREFSYALLRAVSRFPEDKLQAALARLVISELVFQRGTPPDAVYTFKHALVQDAAHSSLLRSSRQQLHAQIAAALEAHSPDLVESQDEELLQLSLQRNDSAGLVLGHVSSGRDLMVAGRFAPSRLHLEAVLTLYDPISHHFLSSQATHHPTLMSQAILGIVLVCLGYLHQALAQSSAAIAEAHRLGHPPDLVPTLGFGCRVLTLLREVTLLSECVGQMDAVATEQGFPFWRAQGTIYRGWVKVENGDVMEGISLLRSGASAVRATGAQWGMSYYITLLAKPCEMAGQIEEALTLMNEALQIADSTGERWLVAEMNRHKGQLLLRQGHSTAAEELYRKALSIAVEQEAKLWELRAAMSLARLRRDQGRLAEARDLLAPVYGWFTKGFDTADLKEAKALVDQLA